MSSNNLSYSPCLSEEELRTLAYRPGTHPREKELLAHISNCELCSDALDGLQLLSEPEYAESLTVITEKIEQQSTNKQERSIPLRRWYAVAASFAVLLALAYWINLSINTKQKEVVQNIPSDIQNAKRNETTLSKDDKIQPSADAEKPDAQSMLNDKPPISPTPPPVKSILKDSKSEDIEIPQEQFQPDVTTLTIVPNTTSIDYNTSPSAPMQNPTIPQTDKYYAAPPNYGQTNNIPLKEESIKSITITSNRKDKVYKVEKKNTETPVVTNDLDDSKQELKELADSTASYQSKSSAELYTQAQLYFNKQQYETCITHCNVIASRGDSLQDDALLLKAHCLLKLGKKSDGKKILNDLIKSNASVKDEAQKLLNTY